jgi:S-DNA-T family DNA segregation ATPase FtsK/SpoIIIE
LESLDLRVPQSEADGILAILREFARDYDVPLVLNQPEVITTPHLLTFLCDQRRGSEVGKIEKRATELRQMVRAPARIYPVVNRGKIAIEVQRATRAPWHFGQALRMMPAPVGGSIVVPLGIGSLGEMASINLLEPAGLLVAGASGSGKSNFLNSLIASCVLRYSATEVSIDVADIKQVDFDFFQHAAPPHIRSLRTEVDSVLRLLEDTVADIERRNKILLTNQKRKWGELAGSSSSEPYQILIVDEVADLVQNGEVGKACAAAIQRIAQKGRSAGICLILCSQYPKADIIPSATSANLSNRVAFKLQNGRQSSVILDRDGAEELTGKGDCLANLEGYPPGARFLAPHFDSGAEEAVRAHCERLRKLE